MSKLNLTPNASGTGTLTVTTPNTNSDYTLTIPAVTGTINTTGAANEIPLGSNTAPGLYFTGDTNTGIFSPGADQLTVVTGGVAAITVSSGQRSTFPTTIGVGGATPSTSGSGITFPATQSASTDANTLDDYEEGTWTPSYVAGFGSFTSVTYGDQIGKYTKIGNQVTIYCLMNTTAVTVGTANTLIKIDGLPFTPNDKSSCTISYMYGWNFGAVTKPIVAWTSSTSILFSNGAYDDTFSSGNYVFGVQGGTANRHYVAVSVTYLI